MRAAILEQLILLFQELEKSKDQGWSFSTIEDVRSEVDEQIRLIQSGQDYDDGTLLKLIMPTGDLQEIAMANDWPDRFLQSANKIEKLLSSIIE